jgi:MFS family permease
MYTGLSVCFTGPIGYGIGFITGQHAWRSMFWICGAMTVVWAVVVGVFLPDNPVNAKFITERQKAIVVEKMRADQTGIENKTFKREQMIEALLDPKTWLMFLFNIWISIPNGGMTNFTPLIIKGLGYTSQRSVLLTMRKQDPSTCARVSGVVVPRVPLTLASVRSFPLHRHALTPS